jgi:hypothetical protein
VEGTPEAHRPAGSQSAKYSSGEEKSQIAVSLLLRVKKCKKNEWSLFTTSLCPGSSP